MGVDDQGYPRPGVVVVRRDGFIHTRQIAGAKDDRVYARRLIAMLDTLPGAAQSNKVALRGGYAAISRRQLGVGLAGGAVRRSADTTDTGALGRLSLRLLQPVARSLVLGVGTRLALGSSTDSGRADVAALVRLRRPIWADQGSIYAQLRVGGVFDLRQDEPTRHKGMGLTSGVALGSQFAWFPGLAIYWEVALDRAWFSAAAPGNSNASDETDTTIMAGAGVSVLF